MVSELPEVEEDLSPAGIGQVFNQANTMKIGDRSCFQRWHALRYDANCRTKCEKVMNTTLEAPAAVMKQARRKILLMDDDPAVRQILFRLLTEEDFLVLTATNGVEALELAATAKLDLAVLDLNTPAKDGWNTFVELSTKNSLLPIVLIAARSNQFLSALASGVDALLEKPLDFVRLFHTIHSLLEEPVETRLEGCPGRLSAFG
jgi:CheY-like chemotaxis protein